MTCNLLSQLCIETLRKSRTNKYSTGWQQCAKFGVSMERSCELFLTPNGWALSVFCSSRFLFMICNSLSQLYMETIQKCQSERTNIRLDSSSVQSLEWACKEVVNFSWLQMDEHYRCFAARDSSSWYVIHYQNFTWKHYKNAIADKYLTG